MYEVDGIVYGSELCDSMEVASVKDVGDMILLVTFSTGETRLVDGLELAKAGPVFAPLSNRETFESFELGFGTIMWCDGSIDIAPEALYRMSYEYPPVAVAV